MVEPRAADEGGEAPCFAHLVDPGSGRVPDAVVAGTGEAATVGDEAAATAGGPGAPGPPAGRDAREDGG